MTQPSKEMHSTPSLNTEIRFHLLAVAIILICFGIYLIRPYSVLSDTGYQALSARQFVSGYAPTFNTVRLVSPRDLSKDVVVPITAWAPAWTALFVLAFKAGLSAGKAGRLIALFLSIAGALGWVRISALVGLKGKWRIAAVVLAALYCLRTGTQSKTGSGDEIVYAVAPWLLAAAAPLAVSLKSLRDRRVLQTALLSLLLGSVYWLKYSGIFFSVAVLAAVLVQQVRGRGRARLGLLISLGALYGASFAIPVLDLKSYNYSISGTDFVETSSRQSPPRTASRMGGLVAETVFGVSTILFAADTGAQDLIQIPPNTYPTVSAWLLRAPGIALLLLFFALMVRQPPGYTRDVTLLCGAVPLVAFPALSFAAGLRFSYAIGRCCEPFWLLFEFLILAILAQSGFRTPRLARTLLAVLVATQLLLFLSIPVSDTRMILYLSKSRGYDSGPEELWDTDLSKYGTREIDNRVKSLVQSTGDVIVPAVYSNRAFATDTMLEFGGRLLPLSVFFVPLAATHGSTGANYNSTAPFTASKPTRIILVAPDPYNRPDFMQLTERVKRRFVQVREWTPGPADPHGRVWIWVGSTS